MTNVRDTSIETYTALRQELGITKQQAAIVHLIQGRRGLTRREVATKLKIDVSSVAGRVNELVKLGILKERGKRKCNVSGRTAYTLDMGRD